MRTRSSRLLLACAGATLPVLAGAQAPAEFYLPDDAHIVLFTSGGTFNLSNEQAVSWQVDPAQKKVFEAWRTKLVGKPETSSIVKDLLGKNKKNAMKKLGDLRAKPPQSGSIPVTFAFANGKPDVSLTLRVDSLGKDWSPSAESANALAEVAGGLGLRSRAQLEPSLRTTGDGGKPWSHIVRMLEVYPKSYIAVDRTGVLEVSRDETPSSPPASASGTPTKKPVKPTEANGGQTAILIGGIAFVVIAAGAGIFLMRRKSERGGASNPTGDKPKVVKVNAEEYKLLLFFQGEANRRLSSAPDAADREESLQLILTRFRGYPELEGQVRALKQSGEHLNEQVRLLTYYKNYSEQADSFLKKHEKLQAEVEATKAHAASIESSLKALEQERSTLTREKSDLERSLKTARNELSAAEELFAQQIEALDALAADLARLKERIEP